MPHPISASIGAVSLIFLLAAENIFEDATEAGKKLSTLMDMA